MATPCAGTKRKRGVYCAALWCNNFFGCRTDQPISLFYFPKDPERAVQWLKFALREDLMDKNIKNLRLCSDHFTDGDYKCKTPRALLKANAIPSRYEWNLGEPHVVCDVETIAHAIPLTSVCEETNSFLVEVPEQSECDVDNSFSAPILEKGSPSPPQPSRASPSAGTQVMKGSCTPSALSDGHGNSTPRCRSSRKNWTPRTSRRVMQYTNTIARLRSNLFREKKRGRPVVTRQDFAQYCKQYLPKSTYRLFLAQMKISHVNKYGRRWSPYMKDFALSMYYHGPRAYRYLQKTLCLPSVRSLVNWEKKVVVKPGIDENALQGIQEQAKKLSRQDLVVALIIDEVAIKENLFYDVSTDSVVGFCDYGEGCVTTIGNQCLVAMVKGLHKKWKQAIGYWVTHSSTDVSVLHGIVFDCINRLRTIGYCVKVLICDQGPHNLKLSSLLEVSHESPCFYVDGELIYFMFDPPHLLKSIRNNLVRYKLNFDGNVVDWCHFKNLFELTDPLKLTMIPKITKLHADVRAFKKMKVKLASQVFSTSVYVAICAFVAMKKLASPAIHTGTFFSFMDKLFDTFNSNQLKRHPFKYRYAMMEGSPHAAFLEEAFIKLKNSFFEECRRQPPCLNGWLLSISCLLKLQVDLKDHFGILKLRTRALNQDALENMFSVIRQQHGCNNNPTVVQFGRGYKQLMLTSLSKLSRSTNCELDVEQFLVRYSDFVLKNSARLDSTGAHEEVDVTFSDIQFCEDSELDELNVIYYISGYICKLFLKKHNCDHCRACLVSDKTSGGTIKRHQLFTHFKGQKELGGDFGNLIIPKDDVFVAIKKWEMIFQCIFLDSLNRKGIGEYIIKILHQNGPIVALPCELSSELLTKLFVRVRIFWGVRLMNRKEL